jgi:lipoprotein-anchoring transpeptidase ErfK/SrfK
MHRRAFILGAAALLLPVGPALANHEDAFFIQLFGPDPVPTRKRVQKRPPYQKKSRDVPRERYGGKTIVTYKTNEKPGTVIVTTSERTLHYVLPGGKAIRYKVAVGKEGFSWAGIARIGSKVEWPSWTPPEEMIERRPELAEFAEGMPGGPDNPLGARALYLYQGSRDTMYRIHGTNEPSSIGTAASSGCIRMLNEEVIDLYNRVRIGTKVVVI